MKKILYVVTKSNLGGAQKYVLEAAEAMKKEGFDVYVACGGQGLLTEKLLERGIPTYNIEGAQRDISIFKEIKAFFSLGKIIRQIRPDVLHLNSPKIGGLGSLIGRLLRIKKIVYTNHGWAFNEERSRLQKAVIKTLSYITVLLCHKVVLLSRRELEMVHHWAIPHRQEKFVLIPVGVHPFEPLSREEAQVALLGSDTVSTLKEKGGFILGTIGELTKNKGYIYVLQALRKLMLDGKEFVYIVIGEGEDYSMLESLAKELGIARHIVFAGRVDQAKKYLSAFDIFILGSIKEGLPYVLIEAGFSQTPVVATNVGGIPELITNMKDGLVVYPRRPEEIHHALTYALNNQDKMKDFAHNLHNKVTYEYSLDAIHLRLKQLYIA